MPITSVKQWLPTLVDPYLKTSRAKEHLEALRNALAEFRESKPYSVTTEDDLERQRFRIRFKMDDIPHGASLILGDLLYCLRSSLDQLVWSLAKLTTKYPQGTQFPILDVFDKDSRRRFRQQTTGVPADAVAIIEGLQPYHGPDSAAIRSRLLWRLNKLCNIDKHRRIPIHSIAQDFKVFPKSDTRIAAFVEFEKDEVVSMPLRFKSQMAPDPDVTMEIIFGDMAEGIECTFEGIERIHNFVTNSVIPRFTRFFE